MDGQTGAPPSGDEMVPLHHPGDAPEHPVSAPPPPSYDHVLQETRLEASQQRAANAQQQDGTTAAEAAAGAAAGAAQDSGGGGTAVRPAKPIEIIHKSTKELYRAVAAELGITCKMSDHCRCLDCQSRYFDCEYEQNENEKTDGGLGAGTPMFISEVIHGTACSIL